MSSQVFTYRVVTVGGRGPDAWELDERVEAGDIREALDQIAVPESGEVVLIEKLDD